MIYGLGYVVGEKGEKFWGPNLKFIREIIPLQISQSKMDLTLSNFYNHQSENSLNRDQYLIKGVYFELIQSAEEKLITIKGSSRKSVEKIAKEFDLPINKANLSAQDRIKRAVKKRVLPFYLKNSPKIP